LDPPEPGNQLCCYADADSSGLFHTLNSMGNKVIKKGENRHLSFRDKGKRVKVISLIVTNVGSGIEGARN
jgi:hypothetical protein